MDYVEADRRRVAQALHDEAVQTLANLALRLQICDRAVAVDVARGRAELAAARDALGEAIGRLRHQIFVLHPVILGEAGIATTLRRYVSLLAAPDRPTVEVADRLGPRRFAEPIELALYRVAQAAIDNALAHAGARQIRVELSVDGAIVRVAIHNDGAGFDAAAALARARSGEAVGGLSQMLDWTNALGGSLDLESSQAGTVVSATFPIG